MRFGWLAAAALVTLSNTASAAVLVKNINYYYPNGDTGELGERFDPTLGKLKRVELAFDVRAEYYLDSYSYDDDGEETPSVATTRVDNLASIGFDRIGLNLNVKVAQPTVTFSGNYGTGLLRFFAYGSAKYTTNDVDPFIISASRPDRVLEMTVSSSTPPVRIISGPATLPEYEASGTARYIYNPIGAVPEPASWAMMISGFGLIGGALRRQRKVKTTVRFA
jgi:hypothetical protein